MTPADTDVDSPESIRRDTAELPLLERLGVRYFRSLSKAHGPIDAGDGVAYLNPKERHELRRVVRAGVTRAAAAGAFSTVVSGVAEIIARAQLHPDSPTATAGTEVKLWLVIGIATACASVVEISYLYWDGLKTVHELTRVAGLDLFPQGERTAVSQAMARAALELPNSTAAVFGVDPRREASKLGLFIASIVYKAKISASNFVAKALIRSAFGRVLVRTWLPLVSVPVTAAWNGIVAWLILREARVRAMGPSAAEEMVDAFFGAAPELSDLAKAAALRAVASSIVRTRDMHPNLVELLIRVRARVGDFDTHALDDPHEFIACLKELSHDEQSLVLGVLSIAAILDGKLTRAEKLLVGAARQACGREPKLAALDHLRKSFLAGDALDREALKVVGN
ncbi:MAG: hypothetical protein ABI461_16690 [Polyangiaceae bacterium]